ncbi:MAG: hypothetical protein KBC38_00205 [Candidatus Pacebacteria bacterium]|nr:hypothetical protein [Candidatus Paceibacterota bacterium]MBP9840421.1 hypothetical protein [Candidatus Paceibacterota bacterium]
MDIDDLSKSQLLLLTLLVNFVMSIATGIVTVSLLDEAPPVITQTVNRIVEHTVETVAPAVVTPGKPQPSEEDRLVSAVAVANARTVFLYDKSTTTPAIARGMYLPTSRSAVFVTDEALPNEAIVGFANGASSPVSLTRKNGSLMLYGFSDNAALPPATAANPVPSSSLKQGQAVIAIRADGSAVTGIVSKVDAGSVTTTLPETTRGSGAVDLSGRVVGISTGAASTYIGAESITSILEAQ